MIERLELKNFTVFDDLTIDFSPKINVIIGENGTGKTHLLKAAYGLCASAPQLKNKSNISDKELGEALTTKLLRLFMPLDNTLGKMHRRTATDEEKAYLSAQFTVGQKITATFNRDAKAVTIQDQTNYNQYQTEALFIPTKEVFSLVKGLTNSTHDRRTVEMIFDDGYMDLANALMKSSSEDIETLINRDSRLNEIVKQLVNLIGGRYQWQSDGFCFQEGEYNEIQPHDGNESEDENKIEDEDEDYKSEDIYRDNYSTTFMPKRGHLYASSMTAEGFRKIGILHQLLSNGTIDPGISGPLFWDEPESNLNPMLMKNLVKVLLELSRNGQQVILATHDYVLLKWFDLISKEDKDDHVRFHTLYRDEQSSEDQAKGVQLNSTNNYRKITENAIIEAFNDLTVEHARSSLRSVTSE